MNRHGVRGVAFVPCAISACKPDFDGMLNPMKRLWRAVWIGLLCLIALSACTAGAEPSVGRTASVLTPTREFPLNPTSTPSLTPLPPRTTAFPTPRFTSVTPVPPPVESLELPDEVIVYLLAGMDRTQPFVGRTDALQLIFLHPRFAKVALISLAPDLFVYLPGYSMQRLSAAYPLGGMRLLRETLAYNLGVTVDEWAVMRMDDFAFLVDELGGIEVPVLEAVPGVCGDRIYPGQVFMNGELALCYARLRQQEKETARGLRQQALLEQILLRLAQGGNLVRLPGIFEVMAPRLETSLSREDVVSRGALALRLSDTRRLGYFQIGENAARVWEILDNPRTTVFLPDEEAVRRVLEQAVAFVSRPEAFSERIATLEFELTISPTPTPLPTDTPIPPSTSTPLPTATRTPTPVVITPTNTPTLAP